MKSLGWAVAGLAIGLLGCAPDQEGETVRPAAGHEAITIVVAPRVDVRHHSSVDAAGSFSLVKAPTGMSLWSKGSEYLVVDGDRILATFSSPEPVIENSRRFARTALPAGTTLWASGRIYAIVRDGRSLTTFERPSVVAVAQAAPATVTSPARSTTPYSITVPASEEPAWRYPPLVVENGSYYGEIGDRTDLPRTNYVNGYYRRDGTYVRSYYRSR